MPTIDDKVVAMSFESSKFESGVNKSLSSIEKLKAALNFSGAGKSLVQVGDAAHQVDLGHIAKGVDEVSGKLNALRLAAVAVFADIARKAVAAGTQFVKAFTIDPIKAGFQEYSVNLNAIQTILANTQAAGSNLKDVNAALNELNRYSDKTIYNFSQMAKNIGTFTAAGVDLKTSTAAIKGIANLAALSGSNADQASTAMYQLSQAISAGSVKLQDWNSVVNAGMGGTVFQRALAQTAEAMGKLNKGAVQLSGPMKNVKINGEAFRQSLSVPGKASWLTSDVLTTTLKQFTGDLKDSELAAMGFSKAQIASIQQTAKTAMHAATEVKTISQVFDVAKETAGSGWAATFQIIFGTFTEAKKTFTDLSNTINGFINANAKARNNVLKDWKALGGRTVLIDGIKTAFKDLIAVLKPIKQAFRDIFPAVTGKQLYDLTVRFDNFMKTLKPSKETIENLRRTFRGVFAVLDIGKAIIFGIVGAFGKLFGQVGKGGGGFLKFTAAVGDALVAFHDWLIESGRLAAFFDKLGNILAAPIQLLHALGQALSDAFAGFSPGGIGGNIDGLTKKLSPLQRVMEAIAKVWKAFLDGVANSGKIMQPIIEAIAKGFEGLGPAITQTLNNMNFQAILAVIRTGLFAGLVVMFKQFLGRGSAINQLTKGFGGGILKNISGSFKALQGSMVALQQNIKAKTLKEIAIAVALLTASVVALSFVDPERLKSSLAAMTVAFGQLLGAMAILGNITKTVGFIKMPVIAASLIALAFAIDTLSIAVIALSRLSWSELLKGLAGVAGSLGILVKAVGPLSASSPGMIRAGLGMIGIAIALRIMANAIKAMGSMDLPTLAKGLGSVAIGLTVIVTAMKKMPIKGMAASGAGMILIAVALRVLGEAVAKFGGMDLATIGKGMGAIAASLIIIGVAMRLMPKGMILQAVALGIVAGALQLIAKAVGTMGGMSMTTIAKGLGTLAAALIILGVALYAMEGTVAGAIALGVAAAGITLLAGALKTMGEMSWMDIIKAMVALSAAFTIIGIAAALITPAIPSLLGFGAAIFLIGGGLALTGAALFLVAAGLSALVVAAPTGFGIISQAIVEFQKSMVENAKLIILGVLEIVKALADTAPQFVDAIVKILNSVIDGLMQIVPKLVPLMAVIVTAVVDALAQNQGKIIKAGYDLIIALLQGLRNNIGQIAQSAVEVVAALITGIARNISKIVDAGVKLVTAFLKAIASGYAGITRAGISIITKFLAAIANNIGRVATAGLNIITKLLGAIARSLGRVIKAGTDVIVAFINGVGNAGPRIVSAATNAIIKFINALGQNGVKLANAGMQAITKFLNGVADAIDKNSGPMRQAGIRIGKAIVNGMTGGITAMIPELLRKAGEVVGKVKKKLEFWKSPPSAYGKYIGQEIISGFALGLSNHTEAIDAAGAMSRGVITAVEGIFEITSPSKVFKRIGNQIAAGLAQGIKQGTEQDVRQSFSDVNTLLANEIAKAKQIQADARAARKKETDKKPKDQNEGVIRKANQAIAEQATRINELTRAHKLFNGALKDQRGTLIGYAQKLEKLNADLENAQSIFQEFKDQYVALPDFLAVDSEGNPVQDQLGAYSTALGDQVAATEHFSATLAGLKTMGLDDQTYEALLKAGPEAAGKFADQLLAAGPASVKAINDADIKLGAAATTLGNNAAKELYDAGAQAAKGFVSGLTTEIENLKKTMDTLADTIVHRIKRKLKVKSPSEVFAEIGRFSMEGLAKGFSDGSQNVSDAADQVGQEALTAMQKSMREVSDAVVAELDVNPTITPVLDLTQVKSKAAELAALTATASNVSASAISTSQAATQAEQVAVAGGTSVKFEQNNYSPEALSDIEIYRQTKNQLSQLKSSLALT